MKLFWWKEMNNFGDMLSPLICRYMGAEPVWTDKSPKVLAVGSILGLAREGDVIWGSGLRRTPTSLPKDLTIKAVRGPLTAEYLRKKGYDVPEVYSDPALLLPLFYTPVKLGGGGTVVIPHFHDRELHKWALSWELPVVDVICDDPLKVVDAICAADFVITSSLHVLIVAESYGIPAALTYCGEPRFKYQDYFASTGRSDLTQYIPVDGSMLKPIKERPKFPKPRLLDCFTVIL